MKQQKAQSIQVVQNKSIKLTSSYLYYDILCYKKFHQPTFLIPDTILLQKGHLREWLFNSKKQGNKILRKRRQNCSPLNVIRNFCYKLGYTQIGQLKNISDIKSALIQLTNERSKKQNPSLYKANSKIESLKSIQIVTIDDQIYSMTLLDFVSNVAESKYNQYMFYEKWKLIRQKVNSESRIDQCYAVDNIRKNHLIQSKCQKVIAVSTNQLTTFSSTDLDQKFPSASKQLITLQTKNIQGYKFFDTFLNKKFFNISEQIIQFIQKNYKCIVVEIKTKFIINKERQPHLVGIDKLIIKPVKKIIQMREFTGFNQQGTIKVDDYIKLLLKYVGENQLLHNQLISPLRIKKFKCHGNFCQTILKKLPHVIDPILQTRQNKPFSVDSNSNRRKIASNLITAVKKRKQKVSEKLRLYGVINAQEQDSHNDSSQYQESDQQTQKNLKVCQNCYNIYMHIHMLYQLDLRSGNLIQRNDTNNNLNTLIKKKSQSLKVLPPILNKLDQSTSTIKNLSPNRLINKFTQKIDQQKIYSIQKRNAFSSNKNVTKNLSRTNIHSSNSRSVIKAAKIQAVKAVKLDSLQEKALKTLPTKGSRLMALSKPNYPLDSKQAVFKSQSIAKMSSQKIILNKANNFVQAQQNLLKKLSLLPSSSKQQFLYFARKYYLTNLPQQVDRKCFSSEYLNNLYQFMLNSNINLHFKNRIRKTPQISLKRLSQLTDYPQIVSKSAFYFSTLITDQKTTIPYCIISSEMINSKTSSTPYQNIFIINDIFDCFIQYIPLVKDILQNTVNKRVILFNYHGQSHTIYQKQQGFHLQQFSKVLDKLIYRISSYNNQLAYINHTKDKFRYLAFGYGGYLIAQYLGNAVKQQIYDQNNLKSVMLVNTYKNLTKQMIYKAKTLHEIYTSDNEISKSQAFLEYNKCIGSSQLQQQDLQYKSGLNPIRLQGRSYLLKSLLDLSVLQHNHHNLMIQNFEQITFCPIIIVYGNSNVLFTKTHARRYLFKEHKQLTKQEIFNRKFIQLDGGHDLIADNYQGLQAVVQGWVKG